MAPSIYIYETLEEYMLLYPTNSPKDIETPIIDFYMYERRGVWLVVDTEKKLGPISKNRSLNVILDGERGLARFMNGDDEVVQVPEGGIEYFYKENQLVFRLEDQVQKFTVDRYIGEPLTQGKWKDWFVPSIPLSGFMMYDVSRNRINLILKDFSSQEKTSEPSSLSQTSS